MTTMETTEVTYSTLAEIFTLQQRGDDRITVLADDAPEWAGDFVREAHGTDLLPDDIRYRWIADALDMLWEAQRDDRLGDLDELGTEWADDTDVYTSDLLAWLSSNLLRISYCDQAQEEGLLTEDADMIARISIGQYMERRELFARVVEAAAQYLTEGDEE